MTKRTIKRVHFIGIGGVGMSGIARIAHDQGMEVSGSDIKTNRYTTQLKDRGVKIFVGHDQENVLSQKPDVVVVSTAILENNPELIAAKEHGIEVWHRAKMLAALGEGRKTLAVAGTHGKTTTSSMLASTLDGMGKDPTFLIGGAVHSYGTNAHSGESDLYVVEADESDKSFTYLSPYAILVTNIEADHLDHYSNLEEIYGKFEEFIRSIPAEGICVVCGEDNELVEVAKASGVNFFTYGFGDEYDISIRNYEPHGIGSDFICSFPDGATVATHIKQSPGRHNVLNGAGVLALTWALGFSVEQAATHLAEFSGVRRRFDIVGEVDGIVIVDDYAHHPTEIEATVAAANALDFDRVHVLFQPHRYSRAQLFTEILRDDFGKAFDLADTVTFMDVYPAGEMPLPGISGKTFMQVILDHEGHPPVEYLPSLVEVAPYFVDMLKSGDLLITMGAGDVTAIGPQILDLLKQRK